MNLQLILVIAIFVIGITGYTIGRHDGRRLEREQHEELTILVEEAAKASRIAAAEAIAQIEVKNVHTTQRLEKEIVEVPVYAACEHSDDAFSVLSDAFIAPEDRRDVDPGVVPEVEPSRWEKFWGNDPGAEADR